MAIVLKLLQLFMLIAPIVGTNLDLFFDKLEIKPEANVVAKVEVDVEKEDKAVFKVSGQFEQLNPMDDKYTLQLTVYYSPTPHGFIQLAYLPRTGVCTIMTTIYKNLIYEKLMKACVNAPSPDTCPLLPAKYEIKNYMVDLNRFEDFFIQGYYKIQLDVFEGNNLRVEFIAHGHAVSM